MESIAIQFVLISFRYSFLFRPTYLQNIYVIPFKRTGHFKRNESDLNVFSRFLYKLWSTLLVLDYDEHIIETILA